MRRLLLLLCAVLLLAACQPQPAPAPTLESPPSEPTKAPVDQSTPTKVDTPTFAVPVVTAADEFAFAQLRRLGRGVNLGNALEAPTEGEWGVTLEEGYFQLIQDAGFNSVRIPIRWNAHALEEAPYTIDPEFFARVDWAVDQALQRDLVVVINMHHYLELMETPRVHTERFLALWEQIAKHYQDYQDSLYFEPLNEPNGSLGVISWNSVVTQVVGVIRKTNPARTIILGPGNWNNIYDLPALELPKEDRNLIITVHYYSPFEFTHQGAEWADGSEAWMGTTWDATEDQVNAVVRDMNAAARWGAQNVRPIYLGEFGAYSKAGIESRERWTAFVARAAEERGFAWAYWEFCAGFGVYDSTRKAWNEPIKRALLPCKCLD